MKKSKGIQKPKETSLDHMHKAPSMQCRTLHKKTPNTTLQKKHDHNSIHVL